jgi:hypothetical protein
MSYNLFLWVNQSNGDTLGIIPVLELLFEKYPETNVRFACYEDQAYLLNHFPLEVFPIKGNYRDIPSRVNFFEKINPQFYEGYTPIHLWGGLYNFQHIWKNQVKTFNNQCKENNINLFLDDSSPGYIELPIIDIDVRERAIYVENGHTVSGHSFFNFDMYKLSLMFPKTNFYITYPVNFSANNIIDCSKMNLIELANVSKKCEIILGKGSGPFMCTYNEINKDKSKYLFQFRYHFENWNDTDKTILLNDEEEMFELIRPINRSK